jgi:hypothetical protein
MGFRSHQASAIALKTSSFVMIKISSPAFSITDHQATPTKSDGSAFVPYAPAPDIKIFP